eukprot:gene2129-2623_t
MSVQYIEEQEIKSAISDLRNDSTPTDWVLLSFESPKSQKVKLVGSGSGGVAELVENLKDDIVGFALVRKIDKIDDSDTVKYAFINFIGEKVGILQKGRISVTTGGVKQFFAPFHVDFLISSTSEISDDIVMNKIQETSGSGSRVLDESGRKQTSTGSGSFRRSVGGSSPVSSTTSNSNAVKLGDEPTIRAALKEFRSDDSEVNWVLFGYEGGNSNTIVLIGKGSGGPNELIQHLDSKIVAYGLVRIVEKIDNSNTIKFAFINWVGDDIHRMLRARLGTHSGTVKELVQPYHVDIQCSNLSEISEQIIEDTVSKASGTASRVLSDQPSRPNPTGAFNKSTTHTSSPSTGGYRSTGSVGSKGPSSVPTSSGSVVSCENEQDLKDTIKDVRNDSTDTNWCLVGYKNDTTLVVLGKGSGGADELATHLNPNIVAYGLVREVERFDLSDTVKFAFINYVGDDIPRMFRAKLGTHSGKVKEFFSPYHVDLHASNPSEITASIITSKITQNSGTSSRVLN